MCDRNSDNRKCRPTWGIEDRAVSSSKCVGTLWCLFRSIVRCLISRHTMLTHSCGAKRRRCSDKKATGVAHLTLHLSLLLLSWPSQGSQETGRPCSPSASMLRVFRTRMARDVQHHRLQKNSGASDDTEESSVFRLSEPPIHREA